MSKYADVNDEEYEMLHELIHEHFQELRNARFKLLFYEKKKKKGADLVFAYIKKTDDVVKHLTIDEAGNEEGFHYLMFIDVNIWGEIERSDKIRIMRHELRHCFVDLESTNPYKIIDHDIKDFYAEIELNTDDPRWAMRVAEIGESIYEEE